MNGTITPYFTVSDADRLIDFLTRTFGGVVAKEDRDPNGRIQHARVRIGEALLMINESSDVYPANISQMHIVMEDADVAYRVALSNVAVSIMEPKDRPHGERISGITDPCGNTWWIASPLPASIG